MEDEATSVVRAGYDRVSYAYQDDAGRQNQDEAAWVDDLVERLDAGARVLDLGCGCGLPAAKRLAERVEVVGVDLSPVQIERARRLVPHGEFVCADMTAVRFDPASFVAVVALYSIIHVPLDAQPALFDSMVSWLKDGGYLLATVGSRAWTGTESDWQGVEGATMYWSHADWPTYRSWITSRGMSVAYDRFVPEDAGGHQLVLARKSGRPAAA